ncbi:nitroreductase family protein [Oceanobacillus sp. AG]|uniref:nitroreductase family protein n=1 Tax=Oceanobacillus sp. AG TaxID=2681969 RepID=UPI0018DE459B|nr:nitroreductase family protein [Oceanobacillus sp. AG]
MNLPKTITERRSIRKYNGIPVEQELIISLLYKAANLHGNEETPKWRCIYYGTYESRQRLAVNITAKLKESKLGKIVLNKMIDFLTKKVAETPVNLVFIAESANNQQQSDKNYASVCSVMQNFQLLGWEKGLGMLWYTDPIIQGESFFKEIGLQEGERFAGILNIGYFDKMPRGRRRRTSAEQKWTVIGENDWKHSEKLQVTSQTVLEMLNQAIWAPNHGLRQPWRFIYVTNEKTIGKLQTLNRDISVPFLLVVAKEEEDFHKREEDFAAISCLVQNFELLAKSKQWQVLRSIPKWIYDQERCKPFGVNPQERIVEVLEFKGDDGYSNSLLAPPMVNITYL